MATDSEKFIYSIITAVILLLAIGLELGGSFVPKWTQPINGTSEENGGNTSFSIWTKRECWNHMCKTTMIEVTWTLEECTTVDGRKGDCYTKTGIKKKPKTECWDVHYCNITWQYAEDPEKIPSLLFMVKAFETPAYCAGFIALVLYLVKILCLIQCPDRKRLHLKAAYLTFSAIAGAAAGIGVIIFCVMLEKQEYTLGWAPALVGVGGFLHLSMACGGYLSWRNGPIEDDFFSEDDEAFLEKSTEIKKPNGSSRPNRPAPPPPPPPKPKPEIKPKPDALLLRSMSSPAPKTGDYNAV